MAGWAGNPSFDLFQLPEEHQELRAAIRAQPAAWAAHRVQLESHETFRDFEYERVDTDGRRIFFCIS